MTQEIFEELFSRCGPGYHCADLYQYSVLFTFINDQTCWVGITLYNSVPLSLKLNTHQERRESLLIFAVTTRNDELSWQIAVISYIFIEAFLLSYSTYCIYLLGLYCIYTNMQTQMFGMSSCVTVALTSISTEGCECVAFRSSCHWTDCVSVQVALNLCH